ncbi:hypothetical protein P7C70_g2477, partial [Phenoliferia sp. Uapishka_3]
MKINAHVVKLSKDVAKTQNYWGNVEFARLSLANENGWLSEDGEMKVGELPPCPIDPGTDLHRCGQPITIIGRAGRVELGRSREIAWIIELERPDVVAHDFDRASAAVEKTLRDRLWHPKLTLYVLHFAQLPALQWSYGLACNTQQVFLRHYSPRTTPP